MALDVLTIGDPCVDTFLKIHEAHLALTVDPDQTQLCIDYADKIPVDEYHRVAAGGCVNVAVSAARLGLRAGAYGFVGADADGQAVRDGLSAEGVDTGFLALDRRRGTNASTALVFRGERTLFVWHQRRRYRLPELPPLGWVYLTSVGPPGPSVTALHEEVCDAVDRGGLRLAFAPGTHQLRMGAAALAGLLRRTHLLLLNRHEAQHLTGLEGASPESLLAALRRLGPRTVVMTDGRRGAYAADADQALGNSIMAAPVVDRTGAGDAYASALLTALHLGRPLAEAMAWGAVQAAHCVGAFGATPGLARRTVVEAEVGRRPDLRGQALSRSLAAAAEPPGRRRS